MIYKKNLKYISSFSIILLVILWILDINQPKLLNNIQNNTQNNDSYEINGFFFALDGDSLRKKGAEIRLLKIDAPEYKQTCFDKNNKEYKCGEISSKFLRQLVKNKELNCKSKEKDIYDRYLAICYDGDKNINYEMVKNGMAIIYNIHDASAELKLLEKTARDNKIGIWQGKFLSPKEFRRLKK
ncbi:thermonuclease family protein [Rickettsiales bacterium]|nr:thermonuclease family protein [Rickettsiales bacterium]MDB2550348.1 thermonuclease family protein [Rickettsiales bacterium]